MDASGSGCGKVAGSCEHSNEHLCPIKDGEFLDKLSDLFSQERLCSVELISYRRHFLSFLEREHNYM
jgi:hypothetical protein